MTAQFAKSRQDHQFPRACHHRFVLQLPGMLMRYVYRVQANLHRWIDVAARAVSNHPSQRLNDLVFLHQVSVSLMIFLRHNLDKFKESLQPGALDFRRLLRGLAFGKENQPVPLRRARPNASY